MAQTLQFPICIAMHLSGDTYSELRCHAINYYAGQVCIAKRTCILMELLILRSPAPSHTLKLLAISYSSYTTKGLCYFLIMQLEKCQRDFEGLQNSHTEQVVMCLYMFVVITWTHIKG